jgi:hypothetical protein
VSPGPISEVECDYFRMTPLETAVNAHKRGAPFGGVERAEGMRCGASYQPAAPQQSCEFCFPVWHAPHQEILGQMCPSRSSPHRTPKISNPGASVPLANHECIRLSSGTVSERPKVQLSKSCVGVEPTVGSNPTGSADKKGAPERAPFFVGGTGGT